MREKDGQKRAVTYKSKSDLHPVKDLRLRKREWKKKMEKLKVTERDNCVRVTDKYTNRTAD